MRGRKPKPTNLKILDGDPPCRINREEPRVPLPTSLEPPEWLGTYAKEQWRQLAPVVAKAGLLTQGDLPAFEQLCDEYDTIRKNPLAVSARDRYRRLLIEFGLTPSSRSRLKSTAEKPQDQLGAFLDEAKEA